MHAYDMCAHIPIGDLSSHIQLHELDCCTGWMSGSNINWCLARHCHRMHAGLTPVTRISGQRKQNDAAAMQGVATYAPSHPYIEGLQISYQDWSCIAAAGLLGIPFLTSLSCRTYVPAHVFMKCTQPIGTGYIITHIVQSPITSTASSGSHSKAQTIMQSLLALCLQRSQLLTQMLVGMRRQ